MNLKIHESVTLDRVQEAVRDSLYDTSNPGFCIACGDDVEGVEPDAHQYKCECCDKNTVYGAEELLILEMYHLK